MFMYEIHGIRILQWGRDKEKEHMAQNIFEEIMAKTCPKLLKCINIWIEKAH